MVSLHWWVDSTHRQGPVRHLFSLALYSYISRVNCLLLYPFILCVLLLLSQLALGLRPGGLFTLEDDDGLYRGAGGEGLDVR